MNRFPLPLGNDWKTWGRQVTASLSTALDNLRWKTDEDRPSQNGTVLWDEGVGNAVLSKGGVWMKVSAMANVVYVSEASQITGSLESGTIYVIDGVIDIGASSINVPSGGLFIQGLGFGVSKITTSETNSIVFDYTDSYSGDLFLYGVEIEATGAGSKVFDLDNAENFGAVECVDTNFLNCKSLGTLANYRQGLWSNLALLFCVDGLELDGNWAGGFRATTSVIVGSTFTGTVFKAGSTLAMSGRFITDMNALSLHSTGAFCDFYPSDMVNDATFLIQGLSVNSAANSFPNMPASDVKAKFSDCVGVRNTYVGGQWSVTTEAATTISAANTLYKMAGTTTYADLNWFSNTTDNSFIYDGANGVGVAIHGTISFTGANGDQINVVLRHWVDATSSWVNLSETGPFTMNSGGRAENVALHAFCDYASDDKLEVWVENQSAARNVTAKLGGILSINERPS